MQGGRGERWSWGVGVKAVKGGSGVMGGEGWFGMGDGESPRGHACKRIRGNTSLVQTSCGCSGFTAWVAIDC